MAEDQTAALIQQLASSAPSERIEAREQLAELGSPAVPALLETLDAPQQHVRWEAAKTLAAIADPSSTSKLVDALDDDDDEVRWVAGEALIAIGQDCIEAVCDGLTRIRYSEGFYKAAHHVFHDLAKKPRLQDKLAPLVASFGKSEPQISVPVAAEEFLEELRG